MTVAHEGLAEQAIALQLEGCEEWLTERNHVPTVGAAYVFVLDDACDWNEQV